MLNELDVMQFLSEQNYRIKKDYLARWHDQKCAPDVLCMISDCIIEYINSHNSDDYFMTRDIWFNQYTIDFVESIFKKPSPEKEISKSEYNKFFQQPMELLAFANILEKKKIGRCNYYKIVNYQLLYYISIRDKNALSFLSLYNEKVLKDNNMFSYFDDFFTNPTKQNYDKMKKSFERDMKNKTRINTETEINRIFPKVLHPIAFSRNSYGTVNGRISNDRVTLDMVMYNRPNFRDVYAGKPKNMTRNEYFEQIGYRPDEREFIYESNKAKNKLKKFNKKFFSSKSEIDDELAAGNATCMHHIFPKNEFEEISGYVENLIALTGSQHYQEAHPDNNTQIVDETFQQLCLLAKVERIKWCYENLDEDNIYDFDSFMDVLSIGLNDEKFKDIDYCDFDSVCKQIKIDYLDR